MMSARSECDRIDGRVIMRIRDNNRCCHHRDDHLVTYRSEIRSIVGVLLPGS